MQKSEKLTALNRLVEVSTRAGCPVSGVEFGWPVTTVVIMAGLMPDAVRAKLADMPFFPIHRAERDPHHGGWISGHDGIMDKEIGVCLVFPWPPERNDPPLWQGRA